MDTPNPAPRPISWRQYFDIQQFRVEPFMLLYMFGYSLSGMAVSQLIQDKLCRVDYDQSTTFCISINSQDFDHGAERIKSNILAETAYITLYRTLLSTLPCMIWAVFLGPWSDTYVHGRKLIMIAGAIAAALESFILIINAMDFHSSAYFVLLSFIPSALSGGIIATMMAVYAYCSATSHEQTRSTRFAIVEICFWIAQPIGLFIGGQILGNGANDSYSQLYNYIPVFVVSFCSQISAIIWVILVINEGLNGSASGSVSLDNDSQMDLTISDELDNEHRRTQNDGTESVDFVGDTSILSFTRLHYHSTKFVNHFLKLFDTDNVRELFKTLSKSRDFGGRTQIWTLFFMTACLMLAYLNTTFILWPYVEKLYSWPPKVYSNVTSGVAVATLLIMGLALPVLVRILKFGDMSLSILGVLSLMFQCILRGSWQHEEGLYLSFIFGSLAPLSFIGIRSRLSKIIDEDERGKLFALLAIIEAIIPGMASFFYSTVFAATIDIYPGLAFMLAAFLLLFPLFANIFIDVYCVHDYDYGHQHSHRAHGTPHGNHGIHERSHGTHIAQEAYGTQDGNGALGITHQLVIDQLLVDNDQQVSHFPAQHQSHEHNSQHHNHPHVHHSDHHTRSHSRNHSRNHNRSQSLTKDP